LSKSVKRDPCAKKGYVSQRRERISKSKREKSRDRKGKSVF